MAQSNANHLSRSRPLRCRWGLYVITDALRSGMSNVESAKNALEGGAQVIQLRDKSAPFEQLVEEGNHIRLLARKTGATFLVNDNPYLAREVGADGVHLGQDDIAVDFAREILGSNAIIGLSTHTKQQALTAMASGVDYIGVGPVYATTTKVSENPPVGTGLIRWVKQFIPLPVVAIGGITENKFTEILEAGAENIAVINELMASDDITGRTRHLIQILEAARKLCSDA